MAKFHVGQRVVMVNLLMPCRRESYPALGGDFIGNIGVIYMNFSSPHEWDYAVHWAKGRPTCVHHWNIAPAIPENV